MTPADNGVAYTGRGRGLGTCMADETTAEQAGGEATGGDAGQQRTFTQEEVSRLIAKEKARYKGFADYKSKAEAFDRMQEEGKSELERATSRAEKAEAELEGLRAERERDRMVQAVASETGVDASLLSKMRGDSEEDVRANAEQIRALVSPRKRYPEVSDSGPRGSAGITREQIEKTKSPAERVRLRAQNIGLYE